MRSWVILAKDNKEVNDAVAERVCKLSSSWIDLQVIEIKLQVISGAQEFFIGFIVHTEVLQEVIAELE